MLDYGYRSKCCLAPIRVGRKKIKNTLMKRQVWVCCKCRASDVDIITTEEARSQAEKRLIQQEYFS